MVPENIITMLNSENEEDFLLARNILRVKEIPITVELIKYISSLSENWGFDVHKGELIRGEFWSTFMPWDDTPAYGEGEGPIDIDLTLTRK